MVTWNLVDIFTVGNRRTLWQIFNVIRSYKSKVEIRRILAIQRKISNVLYSLMAVKLCKTWAAILSCRSHCNIILVSVCRWRWQNCCNATDPEVFLSLSQSLNLLSSIETASGDNDATGAQTAGDQVLIKNFGRVYRRGTRAIGREHVAVAVKAIYTPTDGQQQGHLL